MKSDDLRECLAALAHEQWSGWMKHLFSKVEGLEHEQLRSGRLAVVIPGEWAERWARQMRTPYEQLSEEEKESDRSEADRVLQIISQEQV